MRLWIAAAVGLLLSLGLAPGTRAQEALGLAADEQLQLNFRDAQPNTVIESIGRATHTSFIVEPGLRGQLTIALEDKVSRDEALEILNAALLSIGYAPVPNPGGGFTVLPIESAKGAAPWAHRSVSEASERVVTTLVRLSAADAADVAKLLVPPQSRSALVIPYAPTNSLIIAAAEDRIAYLLDLMRALDQSAATRVDVIPLRYADAAQVGAQLGTLFPSNDKDDTRPAVPFKVVVDPRSNSLVVQSRAERLAEVRKYVALVDVPRRSRTKIHVVRIKNVDATDLAQKLQNVSFDEPVLGGSGLGRSASGVPTQIASVPASLTNAASGLRSKSFTVTADEPTNSLLISADAATFALLADVIGELDRIPAQIGLEVQVWDVDTTHALDLGFDALLPLIIPDDADDVIAFAAFGNPAPLIEQEVTKVGPFLARFTRPPLLLPVIGPDGKPTTIVAPSSGGQLTAAEGDVTLTSLSSPYLLAASGEEQHIFAGSNVPVPVSNAPSTTASGTPIGTTSTTTPGSVSSAFTINLNIARQDVGIDLRIKPISLSDHMTIVELAVEVSSVSPTATTAGQVGPTILQFKVEATIRLTDGSVALLASAPQDKIEKLDQTTPWLGKIPFLGWLFKSVSDRAERHRIVVTVQSTQLHSPSEERAEQMERTLAFERRNLRIQPLRALVTEPYALLVATRDTREAAEQLVPQIADLPGSPLVVPWSDLGEPRWDVYLTGFREIASLGNEAVKLRERGFSPKLEIAGEPGN
ncbi:MAG TPA: secretin N-terminal domain-containing protein [Myxococcota bacterium]|nr:secretin N-terminal domain-containing protein [Myxococcota bacterium]